MNDLLRNGLVSLLTPYYTRNDSAHQIDHAHEVTDLMLSMNNKLHLGIDEDIIITAGMMHDMFAMHRAEHHILGSFFVKYVICPEICHIPVNDRHMIATAILEHRAGFTKPFSSPLSELLSSADRGEPDAFGWLKRAIAARKDLSKKEAMDGAIHHLKDKFGEGGYARFPRMYMKFFGDQLSRAQASINAM